MKKIIGKVKSIFTKKPGTPSRIGFKTRFAKEDLANGFREMMRKYRSSGVSNFQWDEFIGKVFSPASRATIHKGFIIGTLATGSYATGKMAAVILEDNTSITKQKRIKSTRIADKTNYSQVLGDIKKNNIFNAKVDESDVPKRTVTRVEEKEKTCSEATKKSALPIKLISSTVLHNSAKSLASVQVRGKRRLQDLREGDKIPGLAKLSKIARQKIIVKNISSGKCEYVENVDKKLARSFSKKKHRILSPSEGQKAINAKRPDGIRQVGNKIIIKKSLRDKMLQDIGAILTQARAIQISNPDGTLSFKMTEVVPGSIYTHLGIQDGDIIKGVNGKPIKDLNQMMSIFANIKQIDNIRFTVKRGGSEQELEGSFE